MFALACPTLTLVRNPLPLVGDAVPFVSHRPAVLSNRQLASCLRPAPCE
jgi:hypothetical protein